ncbi:MAG: winged helix-turn-helix domain-containing protein [Actinomycetota bacterium]|nr:winged helix-turn-helix domain-containing protein [Actinomycetota bacterium]
MQYQLLGALEALRDGRPVPLPQGKPRVVLAALLIARGQPVSVERLIDSLWAEQPTASAQNALQVYVSSLRKSLDPGALRTGQGGYSLLVADDDLDSARFERQAAAGRRQLAEGEPGPAVETLKAALQMWRGPALADFSAYRFAEIEASRLEAARLGTVTGRIEAELALGRHKQLVGELDNLVSSHPLDEGLRSLAMLALYRSGRQADALRLYAEGQRLLGDELGLDPGPGLQSLHAQLLRQDPGLLHHGGTSAKTGPPAVPTGALRAVGAPVAAAAPSSVVRPPRSLPVEITELIGRRREVADVVHLLRRPGVRLVTLVGPGGIGKSRLSLAVAAALVGDFPDGLTVVGLDAVRTRHDAAAAIALAAGATGTEAHSALRDIVAALQDRHVLLVLDNTEQIPELAVDVAALLHELPGLVILATGRKTMGLSANHDYLVPPLTVPDADESPSVLLASPAVRLFVERARSADNTFSVGAASLRDVARICARLDGLPLAIELAAARVRMLSPAEILSRLDHQLELLAGGSADRPERHRALRLTIDWSHALLAGAEAKVFAQLAVFAGGCTLEAAESVCFVDTPGPGIDDEVLAAVAALLDKSLLVRERRDGTARFRMLETVREYALERLVRSGDETLLRQRHAAYFAQRVERDAVKIHGEFDAGVITRFDRDCDNFVAALAWARDAGAAELLGRLAAGLSDYWYIAGRMRQGVHWTRQALALPVRPQERGILLHAAGNLSMNIEPDMAAARDYYTAAREVFVELGDAARAARSYDGITIAALYQGDIEAAESAASEGIVLARRAGADAVLGHLLGWLGEISLCRGQLAEADEVWTEALALATSSGLPNALTEPLSNLALGALARGDVAAAADLGDRSLAGARLAGSPLEIGMVLVVCGLTRLRQGRLDDARACFAESLELRRGSGQLARVAESIAGLAVVDVADGRLERAAVLRCAAARLSRDNGTVLALPGIKTQYDPYFDRQHVALGAAELETAGAAGLTMTLNEAADYALLAVATH